MLKVKIEDEDGKIKELFVTGNHKVYTPDGMKDIGSMQVGDEVLLGYCTHADAMRKRSANVGYRKYLSERMKAKNPVRDQKEKMTDSGDSDGQ